MATAVPIRPVPPRMTIRVGGGDDGCGDGTSSCRCRYVVVVVFADGGREDEDDEDDDNIVKASTMECPTMMKTKRSIRRLERVIHITFGGLENSIIGAGRVSFGTYVRKRKVKKALNFRVSLHRPRIGAQRTT